MRERLDFMGNGYAGELVTLIKSKRSVNVTMNNYDFSVIRAKVHLLDGVTLIGKELHIDSVDGNYITYIRTNSGLPNGAMYFTEPYRTVAYLLYDGIGENGYLITENDERLLI
jgi:hypothetical protein